MCQPVNVSCGKCKELKESLWPLGEGVCDQCLVENYDLSEVIAKTCSCLHEKAKKLFGKGDSR
jgi:hypothetical protein